MKHLLEKEITTSKQNRAARIFLLALLFFGVISSLLAFPMEEALPETEQNNFPFARIRETSEDATAADQDENVRTARAPEGSALPSESVGQDSSGAITFSPMENVTQSQATSGALSGAATAAARSATASEGRFNEHDIVAVEREPAQYPAWAHGVGVHPQLVLNWVSAGLSNRIGDQDTTLHQIVQIIENRIGTMPDNALADLKNDLAARSLEAQGGSSLANNKEDSTTLAEEEDPWLAPVTNGSPTTAAATAGSTWRDVGPTILGAALADLQPKSGFRNRQAGVRSWSQADF